jgi:N-acetylmuramoyl-L-alanine amidase
MRGTNRPSLSFFAFLCGVLACVSAVAAGTSTSTVNAVRIWGGPDSTRVVFELSAPVDYRLFQLSNPDRVVLDLDNGAFGKGVGAKPGKGVVKDMRIGHFQGKARIVLDLDSRAHPKSFLLTPAGQYGYRLVVDLGTPSGKPSPMTTSRTASRGRW